MMINSGINRQEFSRLLGKISALTGYRKGYLIDWMDEEVMKMVAQSFMTEPDMKVIKKYLIDYDIGV